MLLNTLSIKSDQSSLKMKSLKEIKDLLQLGGSGGIAKRYMVMNSFDGSLTALGIIIGSWLARVSDPRTLILAGLGASIAMGISGGFGAYLTESAMKKEELEEMESAMLENLDNTIRHQAAEFSSIFVALVDGFSPFVAASVSFLPFIVASFVNMNMNSAYTFSIILTLVTLFILGAYLGRISQENLLLNGGRMIIAGAIVGVLVFFLGLISGV
jgi:predicted membrane protein (TIGR00267 family)